MRLSALMISLAMSGSAWAAAIATGEATCTLTNDLGLVVDFASSTGNPAGCGIPGALASVNWSEWGGGTSAHGTFVPRNPLGSGRDSGVGIARLNWSNTFVATGGSGTALVLLNLTSIEQGRCSSSAAGFNLFSGAAFGGGDGFWEVEFGVPFTFEITAFVNASGSGSGACGFGFNQSLFSAAN